VKPGREGKQVPPPREDSPAALQKPRQPGRIRAFILAAAVHAAFFALIVFGVTWQSSPTAPLVAELWDKLPPVAKPQPPKPEPAKPEPPKPEPPKPEPEPPKPEPEKKPEPPKPEPPKPDVKPEPPKPDPAIAEKAKREKEKRERLEREKEEKRKAEEVKKKREQEEAKKKQEEDKRRREEEARKREAEKARAEAAARQKTEVDKYVDAIRSKIRGKANVPDNVTGNPEVHVRLRILPGGEVLEATIVKSSGNRAYDAAIERAIRSAQPLPVPPPDSELFPQFRDLNLNIRHER
jgi:colicin import membrane protein